MRYLHQFVHIMVTLRIASEDRIPSTVLSLLNEEQEKIKGPKLSGEKFIESTKDVIFPRLLSQIEAQKFEMIGVSLEQCYDRKGPPYFKLRGQYARHGFARELEGNFKKLRPTLRDEFQIVLDDAGWSTIAYDNGYSLDGQCIQGAHSLNIIANAPEWLLNTDGTPVLVWDRPRYQEGAMKIPRQPAHLFQIRQNNAIEIVPAK